MKMRLVDTEKIVIGCAPAALTSTAGDGDYVSLKNFDRLTIVLSVQNATTVTGGTITLKQASDVSGTGEKELGFSKMWANTDAASGDTLTETAVSSNTFVTNTTNSRQLLYVIEIWAEDLDVNNGFDCVRIDSTGMANAVGSVVYILGQSSYAPANAISAIAN